MATIKKDAVEAPKKSGMVTVKLPLLQGANANQQEFYSVNFKNYIIQRGVRVEVPEEVAKLIEDNEQAEETAIMYSNGVALKAEE